MGKVKVAIWNNGYLLYFVYFEEHGGHPIKSQGPNLQQWELPLCSKLQIGIDPFQATFLLSQHFVEIFPDLLNFGTF